MALFGKLSIQLSVDNIIEFQKRVELQRTKSGRSHTSFKYQLHFNLTFTKNCSNIYFKMYCQCSDRFAYILNSQQVYYEQVVNGTAYIPLNAGHSFQTPRPPMLRYWPSESSRKNIGIPAKNRVMRYGMRKAPANKQSIEHCVFVLISINRKSIVDNK